MNVKEECQENKLTMIALHKFIEESAAAIGLCLDGPLARICARAEVNRSQVYERKGQIEKALEGIELPGPGRPANPIGATDLPANRQEWELREKVLRYRLEHPDAVVIHGRCHATYSSGFIRFILDLGDMLGRLAGTVLPLGGDPIPNVSVLAETRRATALYGFATPADSRSTANSKRGFSANRGGLCSMARQLEGFSWI